MKSMMQLCSILAALLLMASVALAHGGSYTGPAGTGSTGGFAPAGGGTVPPGPGPAGGTTDPGGNGPQGSGETGGTPPAGSDPGGPPQPGGSGGTPPPGSTPIPTGGTTGRRPPQSNPINTWSAWWFFNDDRFLNLKAKVRSQVSQTTNPDLITGGVIDDGSDMTAIHTLKIRQQINPTLKFALKDPFFDTRAAAVIALGKTGAQTALADIKNLTKDKDHRVRESSMLAMGILGNKEALPLLIDVMKDTKAGRKIVGRENSILFRTRAFAALAIGLIGNRQGDLSDTEAVSALLAQVKSNESKHRDMKVAPIVALGVMRCKEAVPYLIDFVKDESQNAVIRSYAATSLGKIGDPVAIKPLMQLMKRKRHNALMQSCAVALGKLASPNHVDVTRALQVAVKSSPDQGAKNFAIIAMGEIGGRDNLGELIRLSKKSNVGMRCFAAMSLAVLLDKDSKNTDKEKVCRQLHKIFKNKKNPDLRGSSAVALGVLRYKLAGEDILKVLKKSGDTGLRGHLCTALGMMEFRNAIPEIRATVMAGGDIDLRRSAAIALGVLGDEGASKVLEEVIEDSNRSIAVHGAVTQGLGFIGDVRAVDTLIKFVRDRDEYQDATRAFAAVALGLLGDKDEIPLLSEISTGNNYLQRTAAMTEVLTIL